MIIIIVITRIHLKGRMRIVTMITMAARFDNITATIITLLLRHHVEVASHTTTNLIDLLTVEEATMGIAIRTIVIIIIIHRTILNLGLDLQHTIIVVI